MSHTPNDLYPSTRYHKDGRVVAVKDAKHEEAVAPAAKGWRDTPAAFYGDEAERAEDAATDEKTAEAANATAADESEALDAETETETDVTESVTRKTKAPAPRRVR